MGNSTPAIPDEETPLNGDKSNGKECKEPLLSVTFHVEWFRVIGMVSLLFMLLTCMVISKLAIFDDGIFGYGWGTMDPKTTVIYGLYGFNHTCNYLDFNPARLVASIIVPFVMVPMALYNFFFHLRVYRAYTENIVGYGFLTYSRITWVYNAFAFLMLHLWFVNDPTGTYGFPGHYIPYVMAQVALAFMAISQVHYLKVTKEIPWGIKDWMANVYLGFIIVLTLISQIFGIAIAVGRPIIDPANNEAHRFFFQWVSRIYVPLIFFVPLIFAKSHLTNEDVHTLTYD